jgi:bile acid:Na+ symporter, BASS family
VVLPLLFLGALLLGRNASSAFQASSSRYDLLLKSPRRTTPLAIQLRLSPLIGLQQRRTTGGGVGNGEVRPSAARSVASGRSRPTLQHAQQDDGSIDNDTAAAPPALLLDKILSVMTTAFPLFVTSAAILGYVKPNALDWVNQYTTAMLAAVMWGTGLTLQPSDFADVWKSHRWAVPVGVACQFIIMPLSALTVCQFLLPTAGFDSPTLHSALYMGLCLVGCAPGGTASNLVTLIANANVALSVLLTSCSTFLAVVMTPLLVKTLMAGSNLPAVQVSGVALCAATAKVVLLPVIAGMVVQSQAPQLARTVSRWTPFGSVALVSLICGGVVAQTAPLLRASTHICSRVLTAVVALHAIGFAAGYAVPRWIFRGDVQVARTVSIEVGMQNSALAVVLARSIGSHPAASLPGALSATVHSCMGSFLAAIWRWQSSRSASHKK